MKKAYNKQVVYAFHVLMLAYQVGGTLHDMAAVKPVHIEAALITLQELLI